MGQCIGCCQEESAGTVSKRKYVELLHELKRSTIYKDDPRTAKKGEGVMRMAGETDVRWG
ncbi:MAG: hypothetical protein P4M11_12705 [Candidatus Pacebacteria bacterium]|nr:hypothetical protein [Candidatus Paceibacterota bacterium]